ncbi:MAG: hypothetical protein E7309_03415 [Butyrivibrio sp.]|jgi:hypothetical protein|nr:hypothetical protein [Butyrivibrio sp.]
MLNKIKKVILPSLIFAAVLILTGCGGKLETDLTVNEDLSGTRHMALSVDMSENSQYINGDAENITATIEQNCPEEITFSSDNTDDVVTLNFDINFTSLEDYQTKVESLIEDSEYYDNLITYVAPNSVFAKGVSYEEEFTSQELLSWFENLMVDAGYVDSSNRSYIFNESSTNYNIIGSEGTASYGSISLNNIEFLPITGIDFITDVNTDGTYNRTIVLKIPQSTMDSNGDEIKAFMSDHETSIATGTWTTDSGINYYTLEGTNLTKDQINDVTKAFCGVEGLEAFTEVSEPTEAVDEAGEADSAASTSAGSTEETTDSDVDAETDEELAVEENLGNPDLLFVFKDIKEEINLENYISNSQGEVNVAFYVGNNAEYTGSFGVGGYEATNSIYLGGESETYPGKYQMFSSSSYLNTMEYTAKISHTVKNIDVIVTIGNKNEISKEVKVLYEDDMSDEGVTALSDALNAAAEGTDLNVVNVAKTDEGIIVDLKASGSSYEVEDAWEEVFGSNDSLILCSQSKAMLPLKNTYSLVDKLFFNIYTSKSFSNLTYTVKGIGTVNYSEVSGLGDLTGVNEKNNFVVEYSNEIDPSNGYLSVNLVGTRTNILAIVVYILLGLAIINLLVQIVLNIIKNIKAKKQAKAGAGMQQNMQAQTAPQMQQSVTQQPVQPAPQAAPKAEPDKE